jgi:hypothetical protein
MKVDKVVPSVRILSVPSGVDLCLCDKAGRIGSCLHRCFTNIEMLCVVVIEEFFTSPHLLGFLTPNSTLICTVLARFRLH